MIMTILENVWLVYTLTQGLDLLTIMVQLLLKSLLRVAMGAEITVSSFLSLLNFNVLFLNEPP